MPYIQDDTKKQNNSADTKNTRLSGVDDDSVKTGRKALWRVQRTLPITWHDLDSSSLDLKTPFNLRQSIQYNDTLDEYVFGKKNGGNLPQCSNNDDEKRIQ